MEESTYIVLFITTATVEEAHRISKVLLEHKKVACVNIVPKVSSFFWWQDKIDSAQESLLIAKTKASQLNESVRLVKEIHSYDIPEIIAVPIEWIGKEAE